MIANSIVKRLLSFNSRLKIGVDVLALCLFNMIKVKRRMFDKSKCVTLIMHLGTTILCTMLER